MKRGTPKHPKVFRLCSLLKCKRPTAVGYLEMLWHMCAEYTPQGDIGKYSDDWIEAALDWSGKPGHLIDCLVLSGWLDREPAEPEGNGEATAKERRGNGEGTARQWPGNRKLMVHHWHDHAEDSVRKRLNRAGLQFLTVSGKVTGQSPVSDRTLSGTGAGLPSHAMPEPSPEPPPTPTPPPSSSPVERVKATPNICVSRDARVDVAAPDKTPRSGDGCRPEWFEAFWQAYWRRVSKKTAEKAFRSHIKSEALFRRVMDAVKAQTATMMAREISKIPHASTWINQERWNDEVEAPGRVGPQQAQFNYPDLPKMKRS